MMEAGSFGSHRLMGKKKLNKDGLEAGKAVDFETVMRVNRERAKKSGDNKKRSGNKNAGESERMETHG